MIKKTIGYILMGIPVSFLITGFVFVYRYVWFSIETVPVERCIVLFAGFAFSSMITFVYIETTGCFTNKKNNEKWEY
jgi:hypothetical protein